MKKHKRKTKQWLVGVLSAVLVIGSINLMDALERSNKNSAPYVAPEITIAQGATDYDLKDGITYDSSLYELAVVDNGGFNVNTAGDYEVTYSLTSLDGTLNSNNPANTSTTASENKDKNSSTNTSKADSSQTVGNSNATVSGSNADNTRDSATTGVSTTSTAADSVEHTTQSSGNTSYTQEKKVITFTRTVTVKAAVEKNALYEAPDLYLECGQEEYDLTEGIIYDKDLYEVKVSDPGDFDINMVGEYEVTYLLDSIGKSAKGEATTNSTAEKSSEVKTASQEAIYFTRNVIVEESGVTYSLRNAVSYANVQSSYTIKLGTAIWDDESHTTFKYPHAKIENVADKLTLLTVTVENGSFTNPNDFGNPNLTDINGISATWILSDGKSADEVQTFIRNIAFKPQTGSNMNVNITIDGNKTTGFDNIPSGSKLTQWTNGHYYMIVPQSVNWTTAYNNSKKYVLAGKKGYLVTIGSYPEAQQLANIFNATDIWTAGVRVTKDGSGTRINDEDSISGYVQFDNFLTAYNGYYWTCGPEATQPVVGVWYSGEPNNTQGREFFGKMQRSMGFKMNDEHDQYIAFAIEFGGYEDAGKRDPGGRDATKAFESLNKDVTPVDPEATINGLKYAPIKDALAAAKDGDTIVIVNRVLTACTDQTLKKGVTIEALDGKTYTATADTVLDIAADGSITVKDGVLELSNQAPVKVYDPKDGNTYAVTGPDSKSTVNVDKQGDHPYIRGENDGTVQIGNVSYTYKNPAGQMAMVYIPQGMKNNEHVTKAEVAADQQVTIEVDNTNSVVLNRGGNAGDNVTVERRTVDSKVDVKLPSGAQGTIFGHTVGAAPSGGVIVSQSSADDTEYPNRYYIVIADAGREAIVDGHTYRATGANQKFYLGTFKVNTTFGANAGVKGTKPADPHYLSEYTITISPDTDYDLDKDNFVLRMKDNDKALASDLPFATYCTEEADGSIKVTIPQVTGDITIHAEAKRQKSKLTVNGLDGRGTVKVLDGQGQEHELNHGNDSVTVNRNEELTLTFIPNDFTNSYYGDLTGEKGSSFSILTELKDNTTGAAVTDLFTQDVKDSFNWTEKSYQVKYTPDKTENTLEATFTHSSIMHVHVTGGTAEVNTPGLVKNPTDLGSSRHVIVPDNKTVQVTLVDTTGHNPVYKAAYWKQTSTAGGNDIGTDVSAELTETTTGSNTYTYTTQAVSASHMLNVSFEQGQYVDITFTGGNASLVDTGTVNWTDQGSNTHRTLVRNGDTLTLKVRGNAGYGLKRITVNGFPINAEEALKNPQYNLSYDEATRTYTHTTKPIDQAWKVVMDFEDEYGVSFVDQHGVTLKTIPVVNGTKIPEDKFTEMQAKTDALKEVDEIFLTWVDKDDENTAYNKNTVITKDNLVLKPVYRKNPGNGGHIENGRDGSILAADDFAIHLNDLQNLTEDIVKEEKYANVTAFNSNGSKDIAQVTVDTNQLDELKAKGAGTYRDALTFTYNNLTVKVTVEISNAKVTITGRTAHTLTFTGKGGVTYQVQKSDETGGSLTGDVKSAAAAAGTGKGTAVGLDKAEYYLISHKAYGQAVGRTSLVDAEDIAKQFADDGDQTTTNGKTDKTEKASNNNVDVTVDDNGNYKVTLKKNIDHTVEIPDTWENVKVDLGGHTITGDNADNNNEAKPGLVFKKDDTATEHPGTNLEIVNGTIKGGDGSGAHPDGAAGIGASGDTKDAGLIIGNNANVIGGNGANGTEGKDGGNGGAGIDGNGKITPTVNGTVTGGNGGKGGDSATGIPGNGGNGGSGIIADDKTITINPGGTVKGGDAGNGGNATGNNTNPGGNGGNGGTGTETTQPGETNNNGGTTSGGNGGDGGNSNNGNGGNGGNGGSGSTGENNNNGGTSNGGNGGNNNYEGDKGNSTGNSNTGQNNPTVGDSLNNSKDESSMTGSAGGSNAGGTKVDESIRVNSGNVENGTDSDSHIPFGECGFHWFPIVWIFVILGYTVVRVKKLRDESEEA